MPGVHSNPLELQGGWGENYYYLHEGTQAPATGYNLYMHKKDQFLTLANCTGLFSEPFALKLYFLWFLGLILNVQHS